MIFIFVIRSSQFSRFKSQLSLVYAYPIANAQEKKKAVHSLVPRNECVSQAMQTWHGFVFKKQTVELIMMHRETLIMSKRN